MPTASKLVAAVLFAIVGAVAAHLFLPTLPEGTPPGYLREVSAAVGAFWGWRTMGRRVGKGMGEAAGSGIVTSVVMLFWVMLLFSVYLMIRRSMRGLFDGPMDALLGVLNIMYDYGHNLLAPGTPIALIVGGILAGWLTEITYKRLG
ncbi:TrgA family protein [Novosphingobium sp. UBA1939]|uniref:TrgA family protein n=1 Tax=Novosphingobium sp. UBA1939 TaxID=1946982 RepID=UPI0025FEB257|nr:TrgA family protein [Novosphingobium sp. UBA1939]